MMGELATTDDEDRAHMIHLKVSLTCERVDTPIGIFLYFVSCFGASWLVSST